MLRIVISIIFISLLTTGITIITPQNVAFSQDDISLGCCKTAKGTPECVGCGEGGLKCAVDGSLCDEYHSFELGEVCVFSELASEAECRDAESETGCCVTGRNECSDGVAFDSCQGKHWFDGAECSQIPECAPAKKSAGYIDWIILVAAFVIVIALLLKFRSGRRKS